MNHPESVGSQAVLSRLDAVPLGSSLVNAVAEKAGIRVLLIKGLVLEQVGLREKREYADIDVLVEPDKFDALVLELGKFGWGERVHFWMFDRIDEHSMTLIHPSWPVDIDLHRYYPGFLAPADEVFEELWRHRALYRIAGRDVVGNDEPSAAVVLALHALRWMHTERNKMEYTTLVDRLRSNPTVVTQIVSLAASTGSSATLSPLIQELGMKPASGRPVRKSDVIAWRRRISHPSRTGEWFEYLRHTSWKNWPREFRAVVWPPADLYLQEHPEVPRTRGALAVARMKRLGHGCVGLTKVIGASIRRS